MRYKLMFELENEELPVDYRRSILSFIKLSLQEYDKEYFEKFYAKGQNTIKPYTFAVFLKDAQFKTNKVIVPSKTMEISISIYDYETAMVLYNSFNNQKFKKFLLDNNSWRLNNIIMLMEKKISQEEIKVKFISPLIVRKREDRKDIYYSYLHEEFANTVRINIMEQLKTTSLPLELVKTFYIEPVLPKKIIVKYYCKKMEASIGIYKMGGDIRLLEYLYKAGLGSKHSGGFGMFDIIN